MGALARILERRSGTARDQAAPRSRPASDLLHASGMTTDQLRSCWIAVSWLLTYPDHRVVDRLPALAELAAPLPEKPRDALLRTIAVLGDREGLALQEEYVDTFDTRRRGCLHLTYFSHGDTRRRGMALVRIKQDFRSAGVEISAEELPDHLPLVLEFAAAHDAERGAKILRDNRPGVELLRLHLEEVRSPWHGALVALCATLPPLDEDDRAAVLRLAEEGPEEETVGLDGYGAETDAADLAGQTFAASSAASHAAGCGAEARDTGPVAPGPVPLDLMRGRPS